MLYLQGFWVKLHSYRFLNVLYIKGLLYLCPPPWSRVQNVSDQFLPWSWRWLGFSTGFSVRVLTHHQLNYFSWQEEVFEEQPLVSVSDASGLTVWYPKARSEIHLFFPSCPEPIDFCCSVFLSWMELYQEEEGELVSFSLSLQVTACLQEIIPFSWWQVGDYHQRVWPKKEVRLLHAGQFFFCIIPVKLSSFIGESMPVIIIRKNTLNKFWSSTPFTQVSYYSMLSI